MMMMLLAATGTGTEVIGDAHIIEASAKLAIQIRNVMLNFAPIFTIVVGIWGVIRFYTGYEQGGRINFQKYVFYPLIMLFAILQYAWIMDTVNTIAFNAVDMTKNEHSDEMFETIMKAEADYQLMVNTGTVIYADSVLAAKNAKVDQKYGDSSVWGSMIKAKNWAVKEWHKNVAGYEIANTVDGASASPPTITNIYDFLKGSLQAGFTILCRTIIIMIRKVLFMILLIIGPIAMTFEILPHWRGQFVHWLKVYIAVILWGLTLNLIDACYVFYINTECKDVIGDYAEMAKQGEYLFNSTDSDFGYLSVVFALTYVFVPFLTSIYAGGAGAGRMFTVMGGLAVKAAASTAAAASRIGHHGGGGGISGKTTGMN